MKRYLACLLAGCLLLTACEQQPEPAAAASPALSAPLTAHRVELPPVALTLWRTFASQKPALLLYSFDPMLFPPPAPFTEQARRLATTGSAKQLAKVGAYYRSNPQLLPPQTVRTAIEAGMISKLYWVFPQLLDLEQLSLDSFRQQMKASGFLSSAELDSCRLEKGVISGSVAGVPFEFIHPAALSAITDPVLLHIDLSFFARSYKNEIKTPIYPLLRSTLTGIRATARAVLAVSISQSTEEGLVSNDFRFLGATLINIFAEPALLDREMPQLWQLRSEALYQSAFFQRRSTLDAYLKMLDLAPQNAGVHYDLYRGQTTVGNQAAALAALDRAVALDPGYAFTYIKLAAQASGAGNFDPALELLRKAERIFPDNPLIQIEIATTLQQAGRQAEAGRALAALRKLNWSAVYHQNIDAILDRVAAVPHNSEGEK